MVRHILVIGAHPDDCDFSTGGAATLWAQRGDRVKFVSVTNGNAGHFYAEYIADRSLLKARRMEEGRRAAAVFGGEFETLDVDDGEVYVTQELTHKIIRLIRGWGEPGVGPALVLVNRKNDYHRDHRYVAQAVLDATYMLTVPVTCPDVRHLDRMPVFAHWSDGFTEGGAFVPEIVVPIDAVLETKARIAFEHTSQIFEWLPYNAGRLADVPEDEAGRREFALNRMRTRGEGMLSRPGVREKLREQIGEAADGVTCVEAYRVSEYGRRLSAEELRELFPI